MTIRNLDRMFRPRSVALIGASVRPRSIGGVMTRNLMTGAFRDKIMMVNPRHTMVADVPCVATVQDLPMAPDLAVIATPPSAIPGIIADLGARGTKAAVVLTAGFAEDKEARGRQLQQAMLDAARPHLLRIIGPNCLGILNPQTDLNASFAHMMPAKGSLAFVAQSGAVITSVIDWATPRGIGFSHLVSLGDMADVDFGDMLDYLARDEGTRAILLYVEMITHARKFMSAARAAARIKPVIVVKAGRHPEGARAAASHTGALAGADMVYDAAFRRAGMLRVFGLSELFSAVQTLSSGPAISGDRLAILTNGGGIGVLATDRLIDLGGRLAELSPATMSRLDKVLPATWSHGNPVDIIGDADEARYGAALSALLDDSTTDAILVLNCPTAVASSRDAAMAVSEVARGNRRIPVLTGWVGSAAASEGRAIFNAAQVPTYDTPEDAVQAFMHMAQYRSNQLALMETPPSVPDEHLPDRAHVRDIISAAVKDGIEWLSLPDALSVLSAYGIPAVGTWFGRDIDEIKQLAGVLPYPLALKVVSPDIQHKSDVHGVVLGLKNSADVVQAVETMTRTLQKSCPEARLQGFVLQRMVQRQQAHELILGIADDRQFGPVLLFGQGGTATEVIGDRAIGLPPLNMTLAYEMMRRTKVFRLLQGYRDRAPAALDKIALALTQLGQIAADNPEILELDINPLLADESGIVALDARIRLGDEGPSRLAIRPYPQELEVETELGSGLAVHVRPIRPEDAPSLRQMFQRCDVRDLQLRFLQGLGEVPDTLAARLTQIDYEREMAFVACAKKEKRNGAGSTASGDMLGIVHLVATPDLDSAECAIIVRSDIQGMGLGYFLMKRMIDYATQRGIQRVYGYVSQHNTAMLKMSRELGFELSAPDDDNVCYVNLDLGPARV